MQEIKEELERSPSGANFKAFKSVYRVGKASRVRYWFFGLLLVGAVFLFLPWTQNIRASGTVTTLRQEHRTQEVNSIIAGRIVKWWVKEGDYVQAGDTILQLAEVKDAYLDPALLQRTRDQINAKNLAAQNYDAKAAASASQMDAILQGAELKVSQVQNKIMQNRLKIRADSMDVISATNDFNIAEKQYKRQLIMRDSGLASLVQVEQRNQSFQSAMAKKTSAEIKLANSRTDLVNAQIELNSVQQEYAEKAFKTQGERASALSDGATGRADIAKLENQYSSYAIRAGQYFVLAPQSGQIIQSVKSGINEIVKEGEKLLDIVPQSIDHAVEMYVRPVDLPLMGIGQNVAFLFDGYPSIVFSGWPRASWGLFYGKVAAVETSASPNGKFRILVAADMQRKPWPENLTRGTGASGIALLKDVPVWYELWRNINGFPPDYYKPKESGAEKEKKK